jgi:hypothetical protein
MFVQSCCSFLKILPKTKHARLACSRRQGGGEDMEGGEGEGRVSMLVALFQVQEASALLQELLQLRQPSARCRQHEWCPSCCPSTSISGVHSVACGRLTAHGSVSQAFLSVSQAAPSSQSHTVSHAIACYRLPRTP